MTFVGKILVIINLMMSFCFMAFAVMVYTSRVDLRGQLKAEQDKTKDWQRKSADVTSQKEDLAKKLADEQSKYTKAVTEAEGQSKDLQQQVNQLVADRQKNRDEVSKSLSQMQTATTELQQRRDEVQQLSKDKFNLLDSNNKLLSERTSLEDQRSQLTNQLKQATDRNQQLVERLTQLEGYVVRLKGGLPTKTELDEAAEGPQPPPQVEGIVKRVAADGKFIEISLGEDDGFRKGQTLEVWRTKPEPKYIGQVEIVQTQATDSVAKPVSVKGLILQNDIVGPQIILDR